MYGDAVLQSQRLEERLIVAPEVASATSDERVFLELPDRPRDAVAGRVIATAVQGPIIDAEASTDDSTRLVANRASERDVCFAAAEIAEMLRRIDLDQDVGIAVVELPKHRREKRNRVDFFGGNAHRAFQLASSGARGIHKL